MTASAVAFKERIEPIYKATDNPASRTLSKKQLAFIELYNGNSTDTAKLVGYSSKGAKIAGIRNMRNDTVRYLIQQRQTKELKPQVFSRIERQIYWSDIMRDTEQDIKNRLKASELLARSEGDFLDRMEHSGNVALNTPPTIIIQWSDKKD